MAKTRTVGIYGGSFNPAHLGHRELAEEALRLLQLDEVWFMVSPQNPQKDKEGILPFDHRVHICRLTVKDMAHVQVSTFEQHLPPGPSRTCNLLAALRLAYPHIRFVWMMGADNWRHFHTWNGWQEIAANHPIAIFARVGDATTAQTEAGHILAAHQRMPDAPWDGTPDWRWVEGNIREVSATAIRTQLLQGADEVDNVADGVVAYLRTHGLLTRQ
ncbi:MAG: nicotinate (nicotinamide) nucleotide adenylyltransferase [Proteobacteria bacterium]|nr:nicotinate (nicotinamide) nucleotide adenylyltransferase [Pseudomonadota bacterium]